MFIDGAPAVAFVGGYLITRDFRLATWCVVIGSAISLLVGLLSERRLAPLPAVSGVLALIFGSLSLALKDNDWIKMKMTIVDGLLGAALFGGLALGKNPLKAILGGAFTLPDRAWRTLTLRYGAFWWLCAGANEWVRRTQSDHVFVYFRGAIIVVAIVFAFAQTPFLLRHHVHLARAAEPPPPEPNPHT